LPEAFVLMRDYYAAHYAECSPAVLPGVNDTLELLRSHKVPRGLLTGNTESIAWRKLQQAGIERFFYFGAFGDATARRVELIAIARERCRRIFESDAFNNLVIVGDAPRDIICAREGDIPVVAVASGKFTSEELAEHNPDLLLGSLEEGQKLLEFLQEA
jgi:phosphoglycolate phosphatase-like HAD superfamily hydrolase